MIGDPMPPAADVPPAPDSPPSGRDLAARSRTIRRAAGVGLRAMAREAGLSKGHVSNLERGISQPGPAAARWLAIVAVLDSDGWQTWPGDADLAASIRRLLSGGLACLAVRRAGRPPGVRRPRGPQPVIVRSEDNNAAPPTRPRRGAGAGSGHVPNGRPAFVPGVWPAVSGGQAGGGGI